jgi:DNA-binding transcriptional regulator YdaS (Cro superfamily)
MDLIRDRRGLIAEIARGLKINPSAVSMWVRVPAERLPEVERITGIPRHELRPDICPPPPAVHAQPSDPAPATEAA